MRPIRFRTILISSTCLAALAARVDAQLTVTQSEGCPAPGLASPSNVAPADTLAARESADHPSAAPGQPDLVLLVAFSADELRFNTQPNARIRFCWGSDSLHIVERRNLPSPVVAGTTYRNVFIAAELRAYLNAECLSQRLGLSASTAAARTAACAELGLNTSTGVVKPKPFDTSVSGKSR